MPQSERWAYQAQAYRRLKRRLTALVGWDRQGAVPTAFGFLTSADAYQTAHREVFGDRW